MLEIKSLNLADAQQLMTLALEKAKEIKSPSNVAIVDANGYLLSHVRMDDAQLPSIEHAIHKAKTSALFKKSTIDLQKDSEPGGSLFGLNNTLDNTVIVFAGGEPIKLKETVVGAIGISGGTAEQDQTVASFAAEKFNVI
jgi:uncharacterized protein GlcG (DUF336 family)